MPSQRRFLLCFCVALNLLSGKPTSALDIPLNFQQPPTITEQSPKDYILDPRDDIVIRCEGKGKPPPRFYWSKDGKDFRTELDHRVTMEDNSGTLHIRTPSGKRAQIYEGVYQCSASNVAGTALSQRITLRLSKSPLWPKADVRPVVAWVGAPAILPCNPPAGIPPPLIFWMGHYLQKLPQNERVSQGLNGDLYFSNVLPSDARNDYICYARFVYTQTIQQKQPIQLIVKTLESINDTDPSNVSGLERESPPGNRAPTFLSPRGTRSDVMALRGADLELECIAEGQPTPRIRWFKEGGEIPWSRAEMQNFNKTLRIANVTEADEGVIVCQASNILSTAQHFTTVTVEAAPYWLVNAPQSQLIEPGQSTAIVCRVGGRPNSQIRWMRNGTPIEEIAGEANVKVDRDTIEFHDLPEGSTGVYQCEASNRHGSLLANAFINVLAISPQMLSESQQYQAAVVGQTVHLDCKVFASPEADFMWFRDGEPSPLQDPRFLNSAGSDQLVIAYALKSDSTTYTCSVRNELGKNETKVHLVIRDATTITTIPNDLRMKRLDRAVFACPPSHDAALPVKVTWKWDDDELPEIPRFVAEGHTLTIWNVTKFDQGTYQCNVSTELDHILAQASLTVYDLPDAPRNLQLTNKRTNSVQLSWVPGFENNSPTEAFIVEYEEDMYEPRVWHKLKTVPGEVTSTELPLRPYINYCFRVKALNEAGTGEPSRPSERFQTKATVPDRNPSEVKGEGSTPANVVITWKPVDYLRRNGPDFGYRVAWLLLEEEDYTKRNMAFVTRPVFIIRDAPPFTPYQISVQAVNSRGSAPEPEIIVGYSGEDVPLHAPDDVQVDVMNSTMAEVTWDLVNVSSIRGHLKGYKVSYWIRGLEDSSAPNIMSFPGRVTQGFLPNLRPYSVYSLTVHVYNGKYDGPPSITQHFVTPEGVPGPPEELQVVHLSHDVVRVKWSPPLQRNGILTGYKLHYQLVNSTGPVKTINVSAANISEWTLHGLPTDSIYKVYVQAFTHAGLGPVTLHEARMDVKPDPSPVIDIPQQTWFIGVMCAVALLVLLLLIVCFIRRNRGGKYPVKEKENAHPDPESQPMKEETYSDDKKPLGGSRPSLDTDVQRGMSEDSLDEYGEHSQGLFNEDGSFIGQYSGRKEREGMESSTATSPMNPTNGPIIGNHTA
uniref:neuronal cell adhesion molecule-like isoform X1 n=1 Tax=Myxine glutinosa TaxID=7769 RepID=UPI0035900F05